MTKNSSIETGTYALEEYAPTEEKKWTPFNETYQFPYTLEQEMVKKMTIPTFNENYVKTSWKPVLDNSHGASSATII